MGPELIGDGITGYQYTIEKKRSRNLWNLLLGLAAMLVVLLSGALYGLYDGWFDELLPAAQTEIETEAPATESEQVVSAGSTLIGSVLPVHFSSEEEKNAVYEKVGWMQDSEMTYDDLLFLEGLTSLEIWEGDPIYDLSFAAYLPNLREIRLSGAQITDLSPLVDCPHLEVVRVSADILPLTIPEERGFSVEVEGGGKAISLSPQNFIRNPQKIFCTLLMQDHLKYQESH